MATTSPAPRSRLSFESERDGTADATPHQSSWPRPVTNSISKQVDSSNWMEHIDDVIRQRNEELKQVRNDTADIVSRAMVERVRQVRSSRSPGLSPAERSHHVQIVSSVLSSAGGSASRSGLRRRSGVLSPAGELPRAPSQPPSTADKPFRTPGDRPVPEAGPSAAASIAVGDSLRPWEDVSDPHQQLLAQKEQTLGKEVESLTAQVLELQTIKEQQRATLADEHLKVEQLREELQHLAANHKRDQEALAKTQSCVEQYSQQLEEKEALIIELEAALKDKKRSREQEALQQYEVQLQMLQRELERKQEDVERASERARHFEGRVIEEQSAARTLLEERNQRVHRLEEEVGAHHESVKGLREQVTEGDRKVRELEAAALRQAEEVSRLQSELDVFLARGNGQKMDLFGEPQAALLCEADIVAWKDQLKAAQQQLAARDEEIREKCTEVDMLAEELQQAAEKLQGERQAWKEALAARDAEAEADVSRVVDDAKMERSGLEARILAMEDKLVEKDQKISDLTAKIRVAEEQTKQDAEYYSKSLSEVEEDYKKKISEGEDLHKHMLQEVSRCRLLALERLRNARTHQTLLKRLLLKVMLKPSPSVPSPCPPIVACAPTPPPGPTFTDDSDDEDEKLERARVELQKVVQENARLRRSLGGEWLRVFMSPTIVSFLAVLAGLLSHLYVANSVNLCSVDAPRGAM